MVGKTKTRGTAQVTSEGAKTGDRRSFDHEFHFLQVWATPGATASQSDEEWLMLACINMEAQNFPSA